MSAPRIVLERLTRVPVEGIAALLNEPRNARHMPLARGGFTLESAAQWAAAKDAQWEHHGYGPWAILLGDELAGWGGFQREDDGADFALVLDPRFRGHGPAIARELLSVGFDELALSEVLIALPHSRSSPDGAVARWGFRPAGEIEFDGIVFRRYRLSAADWRALR